MRTLLIYCHPDPESFTAAVRDEVITGLERAQAEIRLRDLYAEEFQPILGRDEFRNYREIDANRAHIGTDCQDIAWCDSLIFIYPTWWYGMPAMLKGWMDRVLVPGIAFHMPDAHRRSIRPAMHHVRRLAVFTTCGASRLVTTLVGAPGKRTLLRGLRPLCHPRSRVTFAAHYLMDSSSPQSRRRHLELVAAKLSRWSRGG